MKQRDAEATRTAILEAATRLFSAGGYAGVSVDQVAKAAGVQRSLLLYHFGSKARLWAAVAEARLGPYLDRLAREVDASPDEGFLPELAERHFRFLHDNPDLVRLVLWHKLEAVFERDQIARGPAPAGGTLLGRLEGRLARLQAEGRLRDDVRPGSLVVMLLALTEFYFQSQEMHASVQGTDARPDPDAVYLADVIRLLERGLAPR